MNLGSVTYHAILGKLFNLFRSNSSSVNAVSNSLCLCRDLKGLNVTYYLNILSTVFGLLLVLNSNNNNNNICVQFGLMYVKYSFKWSVLSKFGPEGNLWRAYEERAAGE